MRVVFDICKWLFAHVRTGISIVLDKEIPVNSWRVFNSHLFNCQMEQEQRQPFASLGNFIAWLQDEMLVDRRRLTNEKVYGEFRMSSSTYANVKKGDR